MDEQPKISRMATRKIESVRAGMPAIALVVRSYNRPDVTELLADIRPEVDKTNLYFCLPIPLTEVSQTQASFVYERIHEASSRYSLMVGIGVDDFGVWPRPIVRDNGSTMHVKRGDKCNMEVKISRKLLEAETAFCKVDMYLKGPLNAPMLLGVGHYANGGMARLRLDSHRDDPDCKQPVFEGKETGPVADIIPYHIFQQRLAARDEGGR